MIISVPLKLRAALFRVYMVWIVLTVFRSLLFYYTCGQFVLHLTYFNNITKTRELNDFVRGASLCVILHIEHKQIAFILILT